MFASSLRLTAAATAFVMAGVAHAGQCPADKVAANDLPGAATAPVGVVDTELASIDLPTENVKLDHRRLRLRHMTIAPGGIVPLHSHEDRPALIMVNRGEIFEYKSKCSVPILHQARATWRANSWATSTGGRTPAPSRWS
jgi:hypothetical protein